MKNNYKKLSSHGSINIPVAMRREMGLQGGDPMELSMKNGVIMVKPYTPRCMSAGQQSMWEYWKARESVQDV